jgi:hypothetical protein
MVYDIEKRVERRLSRRQAFMECTNCGHDCIQLSIQPDTVPLIF